MSWCEWNNCDKKCTVKQWNLKKSQTDFKEILLFMFKSLEFSALHPNEYITDKYSFDLSFVAYEITPWHCICAVSTYVTIHTSFQLSC